MKPEQVTATLDDRLAEDMRLMIKATMVTKASLMRQALREFIDRTLKENAGIREQFAQEKALSQSPKRGHLRVIK